MQPPDFHYHNGPHQWCPVEHACTSLVGILVQGNRVPTVVLSQEEGQSLTQRCHAHEASSYEVCHGQKWQQTLPCWAPLCPFWGNACQSLPKRALFWNAAMPTLPLRTAVCGQRDMGTLSCLTATSLVPARDMQHCHWMMAPKSRYNGVTLWKVKSVQCKVDVLGYEGNKEKKKSLLPL